MDPNAVITPYFGNRYSLVGVKFLEKEGDSAPHPRNPVAFCDAVREVALAPARLQLSAGDHACPNAELVLGYVEPRYIELPYRVGKKTVSVLLSNPPEEDSDLVVIIGTPRQLMELSALLGGVSASFGEEGSFGLCGEAVARVLLEGAPSASLFCQGARVLADFKDAEMAVGLPMEACRVLAERVRDIEKGCTAMCGCLTSDIAPGIIESFRQAGFEKSTDFFFGRVGDRDVKLYLEKDPRGRVGRVTITLPVRGDVGDTDLFRVVRRGNWSYVNARVDLDSFGADIYTGRNLRNSIELLVKKIEEAIAHEGG